MVTSGVAHISPFQGQVRPRQWGRERQLSVIQSARGSANVTSGSCTEVGAVNGAGINTRHWWILEFLSSGLRHWADVPDL